MEINLREDSVEISGYVNAVERNSKPLVSRLGKFVERICKGAFSHALTRSSDVYLLLNHDKSRVLGSTKQGNLELTEDNIGLRARAIITDPDVIESARNGDLVGWSFGFYDTPDGVENGVDEDTKLPLRKLRDLDLREVSILDKSKTPAYDGTLIMARSEDEVEYYGEPNMEEVRFNPNHDLKTGRFAPSNGGSGGGGGGSKMSNAEKTAWIKNATPEQLMTQYDSTSKWMADPFNYSKYYPDSTLDDLYFDYDLAKGELLDRLGKSGRYDGFKQGVTQMNTEQKSGLYDALQKQAKLDSDMVESAKNAGWNNETVAVFQSKYNDTVAQLSILSAEIASDKKSNRSAEDAGVDYTGYDQMLDEMKQNRYNENHDAKTGRFAPATGSGGVSLRDANEDDAYEMLRGSFVSNGMDDELADKVSRQVSAYKNEEGEDGGTIFKDFTASQKRTAQDAYSKTLSGYGYSGELSIRKVKQAGGRSTLKGGGSKGATYETQYRYNWKPDNTRAESIDYSEYDEMLDGMKQNRFNPNHDLKTGRFASATGRGGSVSGGSGGGIPADLGGAMRRGNKIGNVDYDEAEVIYNTARVGTVIQMSKHASGMYKGEYKKISKDTWQGSQMYKSGFVKPPTVSTSKGFAMQVVGSDVKILTEGK